MPNDNPEREPRQRVARGLKQTQTSFLNRLKTNTPAAIKTSSFQPKKSVHKKATSPVNATNPNTKKPTFATASEANNHSKTLGLIQSVDIYFCDITNSRKNLAELRTRPHVRHYTGRTVSHELHRTRLVLLHPRVI